MVLYEVNNMTTIPRESVVDAIREYYRVTTYDIELGKFTPQNGVSEGPYKLVELCDVMRKLRKIGYDGCRGDNSVLVERISP